MCKVINISFFDQRNRSNILLTFIVIILQAEDLKYGPNATTADIIMQKNDSLKSSNYKPSFMLLDAKLRYPPVWPTGVGYRSREDWKLQILM